MSIAATVTVPHLDFKGLDDRNRRFLGAELAEFSEYLDGRSGVSLGASAHHFKALQEAKRGWTVQRWQLGQDSAVSASRRDHNPLKAADL